MPATERKSSEWSGIMGTVGGLKKRAERQLADWHEDARREGGA